MLKQITIAESIGKTIAKCQIGFGWNERQMITLFTDNTFTMVESQSGYDGDSEISEETLSMCDVGGAHITFGLITQEEYDNYRNEEKRKDEEYQKQRRRYEYEQLKREFGG